MMIPEICNDKQRRQSVREHTNKEGRLDLNGLDYVEVSEDQLTLTVYFLRKAPEHIRKENVLIEGGRRITGINVIDIRVCRLEDEERDDCLKVFVNKYGDFSTYKLCLIEVDEHRRLVMEKDEHGRMKHRLMHGFDPRYACVEFSFKAGCATDLDCADQPACPPQILDEPEIRHYRE